MAGSAQGRNDPDVRLASIAETAGAPGPDQKRAEYQVGSPRWPARRLWPRAPSTLNLIGEADWIREMSGYDAAEYYVLSCLHRRGLTANLTLGTRAWTWSSFARPGMRSP